MFKIVAGATLGGTVIAIAGGLLIARLTDPKYRSLDEVLWVIDNKGALLSPTSALTRNVLNTLADAGIDIETRDWHSDVFMNFSSQPDMVTAASEARRMKSSNQAVEGTGVPRVVGQSPHR
jgi:hypothetical protein